MIYRESCETYGSPSIWGTLVKQGHHSGEHRVARLMCQDGIRAKTAKMWHAPNQSQYRFLVAENTLDRLVRIDSQIWCGQENSPTSDLPRRRARSVLRRVIGWAVGHHLTVNLAERALTIALSHRLPTGGLLHHPDRSSQYAATRYQRLLNAHGITASMSRTGNYWDNACVESFFVILKRGLVYHSQYRTRDEARQDIVEYIEVFSNWRRRHSTLGYHSPAEFEARSTVT